MGKLDNIKAFIQASGGKWWPEEVLIRGGPAASGNGGVVKGAHMTVGVAYNDPVDGSPAQRTFGPLPIGAMPNGVPMATTIAAINQASLTTIEERDATITTLNTEKATLTSERDTAASVLVAAEQTIAERDAEIARLQALIDAEA